MSDPSLNRVGAFTLIELLVVISIIAILASMLLPTIGTIKAMAKQAQCSSNQRQMMVATLGYAVDNGGCAPPADGGAAFDSCRMPHVMLMYHEYLADDCVIDWNRWGTYTGGCNTSIRWPNNVSCPSVQGQDQIHWYYSYRWWGTNRPGFDVFKHVMMPAAPTCGQAISASHPTTPHPHDTGAAKLATMDPKTPFMVEGCDRSNPLITGYWVNHVSTPWYDDWPSPRISHRGRAVVTFPDGRTTARTAAELTNEDNVLRLWAPP